jgi:hypothetical protein
MTPCGEIQKFRPQLPASIGLAGIINQVLGDWAFLSGQPIGRPAEGPTTLAMEYCVNLRGPFECMLVLRAEAEFAAELAQAATGDPGAREQGPDAFKELCNLCSSHLWSSFMGSRGKAPEPFVPKPSTPDLWPQAAPAAECVLMVGRFPLEARLWIQPARGATRG